MLTLRELGVQLVIKIIAIGEDNNGGLIKDGLDQVGIEHHRERLSAALCVPEDANLTVAVGGLDGAVNSLLDGKILVVASENLCGTRFVHAKAGKVLDEIQEPVTLEHPHEEGVVVDEVLGLLHAILSLPSHETVFLAGNGASLGERHVTHYAEDIVDK